MNNDSNSAPLLINRRSVMAGSLATIAVAATPMRAHAFVENAPAKNAYLLEVARREISRHAGQIWLRDRVGIVDFTLPSREQRFFIVDMVSGTIKTYYVTHGRGSDPQHDGWLKSFSNIPESFATSRGAYATSSYYEGKHGLSMRLKGLEADNSHAEDRAIVVHGAWYANPNVIPTQGKLGRSEGCFVFPQTNLVEVISRIGAGRLLFADKL